MKRRTKMAHFAVGHPAVRGHAVTTLRGWSKRHGKALPEADGRLFYKLIRERLGGGNYACNGKRLMQRKDGQWSSVLTTDDVEAFIHGKRVEVVPLPTEILENVRRHVEGTMGPEADEEEEETYQCPYCDYEHKLERVVKAHITRVHSDED